MFKLEELPYGFDFLEPVIDAQTMEIHYTKHHQAYVDNLNKAVEANNLQNKSLEDLLNNDLAVVKNNAGGVWNHDFFWSLMTKADSVQPSDPLRSVLSASFGSFEQFKSDFETAGLGRFGSGWVWLVKNIDGKLEILSTPNQDNPLVLGKTPVLGCDVWEHAYYLKYQNRRAEYLKNWWRLVNWEKVESLAR